MEIMLKLGKLRKIFPREIFDVRVLLRALQFNCEVFQL
jgi:hypothetical protein